MMHNEVPCLSGSCAKYPLERATAWLTANCSVLPQIGHLPPGTKLSVKGTLTHDSHKLAIQRGLTYCIKCGSFTTSQRLQHLAKLCSKPTPAGMSNKNRLAKGLLPHSALGAGWPDSFRTVKPPLLPFSAPAPEPLTVTGSSSSSTISAVGTQPRQPYAHRSTLDDPDADISESE